MKIMILSTYVQKLGKIDALRKEVLLLYKLLRQERPEFEILLVSIEDEPNEYPNTSGETVTTFDKLSELIDYIEPDIIHIVEATPYLLYQVLESRKNIPCKLLITCVDNDPLVCINEQMIEEMVHISDHNDCFFFCYSEHALQVLRKAGIRNAAITLPLIDIRFFESRLNIDNKENRVATETKTVGFASTPFDMDIFAARGIYLLEKILCETKDSIQFRIPWREPSVAPPDRFLSDERVHLTYAFVNMDNFYQDIDIYLLPFAEYGQNHACPHSFWEAIVYGKPLVVTDRVGIAPLVKKYGIGVVSGPEANEFAEAIRKVSDDYQNYYDRINSLRREILFELIDQQKIVSKYFETYKTLLSDPSYVMTLSGWRESLVSEGKELVKGVVALKEYYTTQSEAATYREKRFEDFPMNVYNLMELQAVQLILAEHSSKISGQMELLDIAAGDGRITEVLFDYGSITLIENSSNMLRIIMDTLTINPSNHSVTMINGDFLNLDLDIYNSHFDVATTFRFIRHFEYEHRRDIYSKISELLKPKGLFLFDVPNKYTEIILRNKLGWDNFNVYDVFWTKESIQKELQLNGFVLRNLIDVGQYCFRDTLDFDFALPMSWVAVAQKINI